ncbi:MAG: ABC transporter ATP-binding protein [Pseudomonadota bacterium]
MLTVSDLTVDYGPVRAVRGVSLDVGEGEVVALLGANGAGKTTTLMAIAGLRKVAAGSVTFAGRALLGLPPEEIVRTGIGVAPEGRRIFAGLTVDENLRLAGSIVAPEVEIARREALLDRFPILRERYRQRAGLLSGGEQQMLAVARALLPGPRLLMLDEPSLGLAPQMVDLVFDLIAELKAEGVTILLVEQNVARSLEVADRAVVLANGQVALAGPAADLRNDDQVRAAYFAA